MMLLSRVDAPSPPDWLVSRALERVDTNHPIMNTWGEDYANRMLYHPSGEYQSSNNKVIFLDEDSYTWARENISKEIVDIRIFASTPGRFLTGPHTDMTRWYTLQYLMKTGGKHHRTAYYKEKAHSDIEYPSRYSVTEYSKLEQLCSMEIPTDCWVLLNAHVLHSVEFIEEGRISLQINLNDIPADLKLRNTISISNYK